MTAPPASTRTWPVNEAIALAALAALAAWAVLTWTGRGAATVALGPLDPSRWFPDRSLTLAELLDRTTKLQEVLTHFFLRRHDEEFSAKELMRTGAIHHGW